MTTPAAPRYLSAAASHQGNVRGNNEDRVHADDSRGIYIVVDGMGGHSAGEHAAEIALDVIRTRLERQTDDTPQRMREAITLANNAVYEAARANPEWAGMACVLTAAVVEGARATIGHVGDTRLYRISRGRLEKLTRDHSPVGEREDRGELNEADAMRHPRRNEVFRDVGSRPRTPDEEGFIDIYTAAVDPGSALLLCSDGLSDALPSAAILGIVQRDAGDRRRVVEHLIEAAIERGKDNVSVVLVEGEKFAASTAPLPAAAAPPTRAFGGGVIALCLLGGMLLGALLTLAAEALLYPRPAAPAVLAVHAPGDLASALGRARPGDTVEIGPGTYTGNLELKSGVSLAGTDAARCILQGMLTAHNVHGARLTRLTVAGATAGLAFHDSDVDVDRCVIAGARDAGVRYTGTSRGLLLASEVYNNGGPGILVSGAAAPVLRNNIIAANGKSAAAPRPGLLIAVGAHPLVLGNTFSGNGAEPIWLPPGQEDLLPRNFFVPAPARTPLRVYRLTPEVTR